MYPMFAKMPDRFFDLQNFDCIASGRLDIAVLCLLKAPRVSCIASRHMFLSDIRYVFK